MLRSSAVRSVPLLSRFAPRAGLVTLRQTFVRRCHRGGGHDEKEGARAGGGLGGVPVPAGASWQSGLRRNLGVRPFPLRCIA